MLCAAHLEKHHLTDGITSAAASFCETLLVLSQIKLKMLALWDTMLRHGGCGQVTFSQPSTYKPNVCKHYKHFLRDAKAVTDKTLELKPDAKNALSEHHQSHLAPSKVPERAYF